MVSITHIGTIGSRVDIAIVVTMIIPVQMITIPEQRDRIREFNQIIVKREKKIEVECYNLSLRSSWLALKVISHRKWWVLGGLSRVQ